MQQLGILSGVEAIGLSVTWKSLEVERFIRPLISNSMVLVITADDPSVAVTMPVYQLTAIGRQILALGKFEPNIEYLKRVGQHIKSQGVNVELAHYVNISSGAISYFSGQQL